jgi:TonB family protein
VHQDRFKPGTRAGQAVVVAQELSMDLRACVAAKTGDGGKRVMVIQLTKPPVQQLKPAKLSSSEVGLSPRTADWSTINRDDFLSGKSIDGVIAPKPIKQVAAEFSNEARKAKFDGTCRLDLIVDPEGMPQQVRVLEPLGYGLQEKAVEAARKYRFQPATLDGQPIPYKISAEIIFHLS